MDAAQKSAIGKSFEIKDELNGFAQNNEDNSIQGASDRVSISSTLKTNLIKSSDNKNLRVQLSMIETKVVAENLNLNIVIQKDLGFGTATLRLHYQCQSLNIAVKNQSPMEISAEINQGQISAQSLDWDLSQNSSEINLVGCSGTAGLDQQIKVQVDQFLKNKMINEVLQRLINQKVNKIVAQNLTETLSQYQKEFNVGNNLKQHFDENNNLWIESGLEPLKTFTAAEISSIKSQSEISILIKKENLERLVQEKLNEILITKDLSSLTSSELTKLTCSRWTQTFVWPALKSLNKCFELVIQNRVKKINLSSIDSKQFELQMESWAKGEQQYLAYFSSSLKVSSQQLAVDVQSFSAQANPDFVKASGRSSRISTKLLQSAIEPWLAQTIKKFSEGEVFKIFDQKTKFIKTSENSFIIQIN